MNHFGDLTAEEFKRYYLTLKVPEDKKVPQFDFNDINEDFLDEDGYELPAEVDWRKEGHVTPVK